jgi:hypothetical protein
VTSDEPRWAYPPPPYPVIADGKGFAKVDFVIADSNGVMESVSVTADSKEDGKEVTSLIPLPPGVFFASVHSKRL